MNMQGRTRWCSSWPAPLPFAANRGQEKWETSGSVSNVHDPTMIEAGGGYYLVSTGPGIPIHCSKDMQVWDMCGRVFNENPNWVVKAIVGVKEKLIDLASNPGTGAVEGAFIIRRGDFFYLFVSHNFCCKGVMSTYIKLIGPLCLRSAAGNDFFACSKI
jgi:beta-xylosidase